MSGARAELLDEFGNVVGGAFPGGKQPFRATRNPTAAPGGRMIRPRPISRWTWWRSMARSGAPSGTAPARCQATVGARGKPGKPGVHVKAMDMVGYTVVLTLSNGQTLRANLLPMLELYERERKAGT